MKGLSIEDSRCVSFFYRERKKEKMSTNRYSRIIAVLADTKRPLSILLLTRRVNERYLKEYAPSLVGGDVKILIAQGFIEIDDKKCFLLTSLGITCSEANGEKDRSNDRFCLV